MSLDERLLQINQPAVPSESASAQSGNLREAKRKKEGGLVKVSRHEFTLRERLAEARRNKAKNPSQKAVAVANVNPLRKSSSALLRQSWLNVIDSYGLTLLWVDVHFFLHAVLGKTFFAPPGEEWTDKVVYGSAVKSEQVAESLSYVSKGVGIVEKGVMGCVNFVLLLIILSIIVVVYLLIDATSSVWQIIKSIVDIVL